MRRDIQEMIAANRFCVLATVSEGTPHCSLMFYAASDDGREIYMATPRNTRKYRNLVANPSVSLLIDTRHATDQGLTGPTRALTITGVLDLILFDLFDKVLLLAGRSIWFLIF